MTAFRREDLVRALPYARRFARALRGTGAGDALVTQAVRCLLAAPRRRGRRARGALSGDRRATAMRRPTGRATRRSRRKQQQLLLLTSLEEVPLAAPPRSSA